ncbi:hypothetical protein GGP62_002603 [Salinibacter ruber]|nr:hypothetical protein [Salinibacter ruber]
MKLFDETTTEKRFYIPREVKEKDLLDDRYKKRSKLAYLLHQIIGSGSTSSESFCLNCVASGPPAWSIR